MHPQHSQHCTYSRMLRAASRQVGASLEMKSPQAISRTDLGTESQSPFLTPVSDHRLIFAPLKISRPHWTQPRDLVARPERSLPLSRSILHKAWALPRRLTGSQTRSVTICACRCPQLGPEYPSSCYRTPDPELGLPPPPAPLAPPSRAQASFATAGFDH